MYRTSGSVPQRSSLEGFILVLIGHGLTTTYSLQSEAGLSLGASIPALKRLQKDGLVTKKVVGRRHEFSLTRLGKTAASLWHSVGEKVPTDLDDILRTVFLTSVGGDRLGAVNVLRQASKVRGRAAEERGEEADRLQKDLSTKFDLHSYKWLRARTDAARLAAEQSVLESAASLFERKRK